MTTSISQRIGAIINLAASLGIVVIAIIAVSGYFRSPAPAETADLPARRPRPAEPVPTSPVSLEGAFLKGTPSAPVTVLEYADLECPACGKFATETFPQLIEKYVSTGKVRFSFRHFPLAIHQMAKPAAAAAQCAGEQARFWEFQDMLFHRKGPLDDRVIEAAMKSLSLDRAAWSACLKRAAIAVDRDADSARELKLRGTPTFLIGRTDEAMQLHVTSVLFGSRPLSEFDAAIDLALEAVRPGTPATAASEQTRRPR